MTVLNFNYDIKMTITCESISSNETSTFVGNCSCYDYLVTGHRVVQFGRPILLITC